MERTAAYRQIKREMRRSGQRVIGSRYNEARSRQAASPSGGDTKGR